MTTVHKIVHVETGRHLYGGAQQVLYIVTGLAARGVDNWLVCTPDSAIAGAAAEAGVTVVEIPCRGDLDLRFTWRLRQMLAATAPDIVHCHSRRGADVLGGQAAAMLGIPAVVSRRVDNPESKLLSALRYRRFERVIAISDAIAGVLADAGLDARKIVVIRSAVDAAAFGAAPERAVLAAEFGIGPEHFAIACAAQLIPRKGQRYLLDAVARLTAQRPGLRVVLFGQGAEEAALKARCQALGLSDVVRFAGFRADLDRYLGAFDVLAHPALAEGLGVITLKAQAAGVPVVAFAAGGLPEAVVHEQTGLLVPPADTVRLAEALALLSDDRDLRDRYARAAREHAEASFSVDAMVTGHLRLYEAILND